MKPRHDIARWLAVLACALAVAGCGSDDEGEQLPASASQALRAELQSVENRIDNGSAGACRDVLEGDSANTDAVTRILDGLPDDVDPDVRDATRESFDRLFELVQDECNEIEDQTDTDTTPTETETEPEQTETETVPTDTETETTTTETLPLEPPGNNGNGKGNGKGKGNGGGGQVAPGDE